MARSPTTSNSVVVQGGVEVVGCGKGKGVLFRRVGAAGVWAPYLRDQGVGSRPTHAGLASVAHSRFALPSCGEWRKLVCSN